jgi:ubiquinone/menaquinone biosynthesis C-methylase UbiE
MNTTNSIQSPDNRGVLEQLKKNARAVWAAGDYPTVAKRQLWPVGERIVRQAGVRSGEDVLDVACGTGNAALRAAAAGARTVGVDLTPELLDAGRALAHDAGVAIEWKQGDAESLPAADESFDVVLSVFGCMFAPRHDVVARELARVLRRGGRLAITAWTPEGAAGRFFRAMGAYMPPPPPEFATPPLAWGTEEHVRRLFAGTGMELEFRRETVDFPRLESIEAEIEFATAKFGPLVMARKFLESQGRWPALLQDLTRLMEQQEPSEYLVILGRK